MWIATQVSTTLSHAWHWCPLTLSLFSWSNCKTSQSNHSFTPSMGGSHPSKLQGSSKLPSKTMCTSYKEYQDVFPSNSPEHLAFLVWISDPPKWGPNFFPGQILSNFTNLDFPEFAFRGPWRDLKDPEPGLRNRRGIPFRHPLQQLVILIQGGSLRLGTDKMNLNGI